MHSSLLDTRQLRAFVALADCGSFTDAARRVHLSQSAVSHAIKALEQQVRCRLFDRVGKQAHLTMAGESLLEHAQVILREMETAQNELQALGQWGRGRLRLAATTTACQYLLPQVLREFKESFPKCSITIQPADSPLCLELIEQNRVDLALSLEPLQPATLEVRSLFDDDLQFIISPLHPWAKTGIPSRRDISEQNYILYNRNSFTFRMIERYFSRESITLRTLIELGSMEAIKELVKINLGVSILAPWVAQKELKEGSLIALPLGRRKLSRTWSIMYRHGKRLSLAEETFVGLCKSASEQLSEVSS